MSHKIPSCKGRWIEIGTLTDPNLQMCSECRATRRGPPQGEDMTPSEDELRMLPGDFEDDPNEEITGADFEAPPIPSTITRWQEPSLWPWVIGVLLVMAAIAWATK